MSGGLLFRSGLARCRARAICSSWSWFEHSAAPARCTKTETLELPGARVAGLILPHVAHRANPRLSFIQRGGRSARDPWGRPPDRDRTPIAVPAERAEARVAAGSGLAFVPQFFNDSPLGNHLHLASCTTSHLATVHVPPRPASLSAFRDTIRNIAVLSAPHKLFIPCSRLLPALPPGLADSPPSGPCLSCKTRSLPTRRWILPPFGTIHYPSGSRCSKSTLLWTSTISTTP
jgi:hypothetical protein